MSRVHAQHPLRAALALALTLSLAAAAPAAPVQLPPVTTATLSNGLTVSILPTHRLPLVDLRLVVRAGSVDDPAGREGLASLTADLMTQGAGARSAQQLAEDIAFVGGTLSAGCGSEQLVVSCEVLEKDLATGLALFHDVIVRPTFPSEEFARKQEEVLGAIASDRDDPSAIADKAVLPFVIGVHPLGHPVVGLEPAVKAITRDDVVGFHRARVVPDQAILAVVGDVDPKAVLAALEKAFSDWKPPGAKRASSYGPIAAQARAVRIVDKPEATQCQIRLMGLGVARDHPDYYPITVANTILGGGFTSRLIDQIRVNLGLTYSIGSRFSMYHGAGTFRVTTFTRNETLRRAIDETMHVVDSLVANGPSEEELTKAKRYLTGQFPLDLQAPDDLAARLTDIAFYGLDPRYVETYTDRIDAVTMADVRRCLKAYFGTDALRILVVGPAAVAKPALAGLGPLDVVPIE